MASRLGPKTPTAMLGGIVEPQTNPVQLVAKVFTFRNPLTGITIRVHPLPMLAQKSYFDKLLHDLPNGNLKFDKVLVEDGRLPFVEGTPEAAKEQRRRRFFPIAANRPVIPLSAVPRYEGLLERNVIESRIAHEAVMSGERPLIDPRARRGVERADSYPDNTTVIMPWNVYHCLYIKEKLLASGYEQVAVEDVVMVGYQQVVYIVLLTTFFSLYFTMMTFRMLGLM